MKIRNYRKQYWLFYAPSFSRLNSTPYTFNRKSDLLKFIKNNIDHALTGTVRLNYDSVTLKEYKVWYNDRKHILAGAKLEIQLRQDDTFKKRSRKSIRIPKYLKKQYAFLDKRIRLMCKIRDENGIIDKNKALKLLDIFEKSGFKDFVPDAGEIEFINQSLNSEISFFHWCDRLTDLRVKVIRRYFKYIGIVR